MAVLAQRECGPIFPRCGSIPGPLHRLPARTGAVRAPALPGGAITLDFLGSLQQLTLLSVEASRRAAGSLRCVSRLERLRILSIQLNNHTRNRSAPTKRLAMPVPPRLQHLRLAAECWKLPAQPGVLTGLETLVLEDQDSKALPTWLADLSFLTALKLHVCDLEDLPPDYRLCTSLCFLDLDTCNQHFSEDIEDWLGQVLRRLQCLEALSLNRCGPRTLPVLAGGPAPPLQLLSITNNICIATDVGWLASVKQLHCSWWQVRALVPAFACPRNPWTPWNCSCSAAIKQ